MIQVNKPTEPPEVLKKNGKKKRKSYSSSYTKCKAHYDGGQKKFEFDSGIYGHKTVKKVLIESQRNKCCFCESKVGHIAYGDVEHFRPKAGFRQTKDDDLGRPGYYWLAYEWENLFFSCQLCNQRYKANLFPLKHPDTRALSHKDDVSEEEPLFVNPSENPEEHIRFREEIACAVHGGRIGKVSIEWLGLNRDHLVEKRKTLYETMKLIYSVARADPPLPLSQQASVLLNKAKEVKSEFSAMIQCAVDNNFIGYST